MCGRWMAYDPDSKALVVPEFFNALPFSNLISSYYTNGEDETIELVQLPPNELMPGYLGSNAIFFPLPKLLYGNSISIIDLNKVFRDPVTDPVLVGHFYGGIESPVPNTTTPGGNYSTKTNSKLYEVYFTLGLWIMPGCVAVFHPGMICLCKTCGAASWQ